MPNPPPMVKGKWNQGERVPDPKGWEGGQKTAIIRTEAGETTLGPMKSVMHFASGKGHNIIISCDCWKKLTEEEKKKKSNYGKTHKVVKKFTSYIDADAFTKKTLLRTDHRFFSEVIIGPCRVYIDCEWLGDINDNADGVINMIIQMAQDAIKAEFDIDAPVVVLCGSR